MLLVKTFLAPDSLGGIGLFAGENIPIGKIIWAWDDSVEKIFSELEYKSLPKEFQLFLKTYGYSPDGKSVVLNLDDSRFFNHSDKPNTKEDDKGIIRAARDMPKGTEITCDYSVFDKGKNFCGSFLKTA